MKRITKRSSIIAAVTAVGVLAAGGVAFAFWTSSGTGSASAAIASSAGNLTVAQTGSITGLYPGGPAQDVSVIVTNPTSTDISLTDVAVTVSGTEKPLGTANAACTAANFTVADTVYAGEVIAAGTATAAIAPKTIRMVETGVNQDACKGAVVILSLSAS